MTFRQKLLTFIHAVPAFFLWLTFALPSFADAGYGTVGVYRGVLAPFFKGADFSYNKFCTQSKEAKIELLKELKAKAAQPEGARAAFIYGMLHWEAPCLASDEKIAKEYLAKAASADHAEAAFLSGVLEHQSAKSESAYFKAYSFYKIAARLNHDKALYNLGVLHFRGQGVPRDRKLARDYFRAAAEAGIKKAVNDQAVADLALMNSPKIKIRSHSVTVASLYKIEQMFIHIVQAGENPRLEAVAAYNLAALYDQNPFFERKPSEIRSLLNFSGKQGYLPAKKYKIMSAVEPEPAEIKAAVTAAETEKHQEFLTQNLISEYESWYDLNAGLVR